MLRESCNLLKRIRPSTLERRNEFQKCAHVGNGYAPESWNSLCPRRNRTTTHATTVRLKARRAERYSDARWGSGLLEATSLHAGAHRQAAGNVEEADQEALAVDDVYQTNWLFVGRCPKLPASGASLQRARLPLPGFQKDFLWMENDCGTEKNLEWEKEFLAVRNQWNLGN